MSALQRKNKLKNLLNDSNESYYWLGFLLADGHFSENNRLAVGLSSRDKNHLIKFQNFIGAGNIIDRINGVSSQSYISIMDIDTLSILKNRFKIQSNKTENPPDLSSLNETQKFCVMVGFIDGDGNIQHQTNRIDVKLSVKCHSSWLETLSFLFKKQTYINARGYSFLSIADNTLLRTWKTRAIKYNLPIMNRKWDKIDLNRISRCENAKNWMKKALILKEQGFTIYKIAQKLNMKFGTVYQQFKRKGVI